ncbi:hypothetical protein SKAU_G00099160 [Synaphobranchus kaupii]|uniref:Uncharacterized protein n=1 Tax=Synaphobranchus kaupii TaxID=118154 RepID=A0A9Q1J798_SYNKA|nr:hypothetical protein SKAU_G00099160 [Synaphobranchus kaupii]
MTEAGVSLCTPTLERSLLSVQTVRGVWVLDALAVFQSRAEQLHTAPNQTVDATGFNSLPPSPSHTEQLTADPGPKLGAQPKVRFCSTPASSEPWIIVRGEKKRDGNPSRNPSPGPIQLGNRFDVLGNSEQQLSAAGLTEADPSPAATARPSAGRSSTRRRLLKEAVSRRSADAARADGGTLLGLSPPSGAVAPTRWRTTAGEFPLPYRG